jgi:ribose transport system substrate-binding protein
MRHRKTWALVMAVAILAAACSTDEAASSGDDDQAAETETETAADEGESLAFGASYFSLSNPHFQDWSEGLASVIEANGDTLNNVDAEGDINKQIADVEALIQQGVSALFIAPADSAGIQPALIAAAEADIPVIIMDVPVIDELNQYVVSTVSTDNVSAGRVLGEALVEDYDGVANVGLIEWDVVEAVTDRTDGFFSVIDEYPDVEVVVRENAPAATADAALPIMENFLQSTSDLDAVFAINDPQCQGAYSALEAAGATEDVGLYCIDGSAAGIQATCDGIFEGTAAQFPFQMGETAASMAYDLLDGGSVESVVALESQWVSQDNCDQFLE